MGWVHLHWTTSQILESDLTLPSLSPVPLLLARDTVFPKGRTSSKAMWLMSECELPQPVFNSVQKISSIALFPFQCKVGCGTPLSSQCHLSSEIGDLYIHMYVYYRYLYTFLKNVEYTCRKNNKRKSQDLQRCFLSSLYV